MRRCAALVVSAALIGSGLTTTPAFADTSSTSFGSVQGPRWTYESRPINTQTYNAMPYYRTASWHSSATVFEPWVSAGAMHPSNADDAVKTWVAPVDGIISITGRVAKQDVSAGDGVVASVSINARSTPLWSRTVAFNDAIGYTTDSQLGDVVVHVGDRVHFAVNNNGDYGADATSWDPTIDYTGPWQASTQFSTTGQGGNQWSYQTRMINSTTYQAMTNIRDNEWHHDANAYEPWIGPGDMHPSNTYDAVRTWTAPQAGVISVAGRVFKGDISAGNGVVASVVRNSDTAPLWNRTLAYNDAVGFQTDTALSNVTVAAGDQLHFVVNNNGDYGADRTVWNPSISYVWDAAAGFSGVQGAHQWRYQSITTGDSAYTTDTRDLSTYVNWPAWTYSATSAEPWVSATGQHPGNNTFDSVRTFTAPYSGTVSVRGTVSSATSSGNGVRIKIVCNSTQVFPTSDWQTVVPQGQLPAALAVNTVDTGNIIVNVTAGDRLFFVVNANGDYGSDSTNWAPSITYLPAPVSSATYYVSAAGDDSNVGTRPDRPWRTTAAVNEQQRFGAGVSVLYRGGDSFAGGLDISVNATAGQPGFIGSYGTGTATLTDGVPYTRSIARLTNSDNVTVSDLHFAATLGSGYGTSSFTPVNHGIGLWVENLSDTGTRHEAISITRDLFTGSQYGAWMDSSSRPETDGFDGLSLTQSTFDSVYQFGAYALGYGPNAGGPAGQSINTTVTDNTFRNILGDPHYPSESQPLFVGNTTGVIIDRNLFANNCGQGGFSPLGGSTAMSVANVRNFFVRYNEVYGTRSHTAYDGSALDLDQDSQNGEVAYNLTYNNYGPGIQLGSYGGRTTANIAIHDNVSYDDVRGNTSASAQGAIRIWGSTDSVQIYRNTVVVDAAGVIGTASAVSFEAAANTNVVLRNNIFKTTGGLALIRAVDGFHIDRSNRFVGNLYDSSGAPLIISNDDTNGNTVTVASISAWRADSQETLGTATYGVVADAGFAAQQAPVGYLPQDPVSIYTGVDITSASPARATGAPLSGILTEQAPVVVSANDFHGMQRTTEDVGADAA